MATSTLLQHLEAGDGSETSNRSQVESFIAGGTIAAGDWVTFDTSQSGADRVLYVIEAPGVLTHGNSAAFGVALGAAAAGGRVEVVVGGYAPSANVDGAVVAGTLLVGPIGTAGRADPFVAGTTEGRVIGQAMAADASNLAPVWVFKTF